MHFCKIKFLDANMVLVLLNSLGLCLLISATILAAIKAPYIIQPYKSATQEKLHSIPFARPKK